MAVLEDIVDLYDFLLGPQAHRHLRVALDGPDAYREWKAYRRWKADREQMYYLRRLRLIRTRKIGERMLVQLTNEGLRKALRRRLLSVRTRTRDRSCFVVFDIPESERQARNVFRRFLRSCDFQKLQQSIWYTDRDVSDLLCLYVEERKLTPWVHIIVGKVVTRSEK